MKSNMGSTDKFIRLLLAAAIVVLYFATDLFPPVLGIILLILAAIFLITSIVSVCPLYLPFGIHTNKHKGDDSQVSEKTA